MTGMATADVDIEAPGDLARYLRETGRIAPDETPACRVLQGGVSNKTVLAERANGEAWVVKQALEKLRVASDWFSSPLRIHREALGMRWLERLAPKGTITPLVFEDETRHILAMQAVPQPHENWKSRLLAGRVDEAHVAAFGALLGTVQRESTARAGELSGVFAERSFFESLRLEPYYARAAEKTPAAAGFLRALQDETRARRETLVHGDYSPKNVLIYREQLVLLDHEVVHWGDGAFDVGFALAHLLSKAHHVAGAREKFLQAAERFWHAYAEALGPAASGEAEARAARHALGCLLARVDGRSPLEYLTEPERAKQRAVVLDLMARPHLCERVPGTIQAFGKGM
ncbi:MAG: phosphotransferase [Planctomycetota bacterium]|nr:phosphotransferase [Planctomycetota bacterium]